MHGEKSVKLLLVLSGASLVLPWFNGSGYCWGSGYYVYFLIPMGLVWLSVSCGKRGVLCILSGLLGSAGNLFSLFMAFSLWNQQNGTVPVFGVQDMLGLTHSGFWISGALFAALLAAVAYMTVPIPIAGKEAFAQKC